MNSVTRHRLASLGPLGRCVAVALVLIAVSLILGPLAYGQYQGAGVLSVALAAAVILVASCGAVLISDLFAKPGDAMQSIWLGMLVRLTLPTAVCLVVYLNAGALTDAGFLIYAVVFYVAALGVETVLDVARLQSQTSPTNQPLVR